jgi:phosphodiesterase/alkaline phosphatase D-like protein
MHHDYIGACSMESQSSTRMKARKVYYEGLAVRYVQGEKTRQPWRKAQVVDRDEC